MITPAQARAFVTILVTDSQQMQGYLAAMLPVVPTANLLSYQRMNGRDERDDLLDLLVQVASALREKKTRKGGRAR